ncbi:MAG: DUF4145 domain-containing protein [Parcubacteria group bacterium]|jgi:hypothetical protein
MRNEELSDKTINEICKLPCRMCDLGTNHIVLKSIENHWLEDEAEIYGWDKFEIVKCQGCDQISFRSITSCSEDYATDCETGDMIYLEREKLYPGRIIGRKSLDDVYFLPFEIRGMYNETHGAMCAKLNVLSGAGVRILVESICKQQNAEGKDLEKRIDDLVLKGVLTNQEAETLHGTRMLGNRSVHEIITPKDVELDIAMDIVENLIRKVYIIPKKAEKLPKRINRKIAPKVEPSEKIDEEIAK